eukprot:scaffold4740_cov59-Phaeocystis_antarctica.AAC.5
MHFLPGASAVRRNEVGRRDEVTAALSLKASKSLFAGIGLRASEATRPSSISYLHSEGGASGHSAQLAGALDQVSDATGALGVAVGDNRRLRCAECVCVKRKRLERPQQSERRHRLLRDCFLRDCFLRRRSLHPGQLRLRPLRPLLPLCRRFLLRRPPRPLLPLRRRFLLRRPPRPLLPLRRRFLLRRPLRRRLIDIVVSKSYNVGKLAGVGSSSGIRSSWLGVDLERNMV